MRISDALVEKLLKTAGKVTAEQLKDLGKKKPKKNPSKIWLSGVTLLMKRI